jgi:hypothetical protein
MDIKNLSESDYLSILKQNIKIRKEARLSLLSEKWKDDVEIKQTGEHADKSIAQLKKEIEALRGKPGNKEKMGELLFALRAKQGWKKETGVAKENVDMDSNEEDDNLYPDNDADDSTFDEEQE